LKMIVDAQPDPITVPHPQRPSVEFRFRSAQTQTRLQLLQEFQFR